jgi:hypothetical protein
MIGTTATYLTAISEPILECGGKSFTMYFIGFYVVFTLHDLSVPFILYEGMNKYL